MPRADHGRGLVTSGPYRLVRHPIYTGFILIYVGLGILCASAPALAGVAVITVGLWIKARVEEQFLAAELGAAAYGDYKARTPMLVPRMPQRRSVLAQLVVLFCLVAWSSAGSAQEVERDLAYAPGSLQRLDLSVPATKRFPTVLFVHGGSLMSGDKSDEDYRAVCAPFAAAGIGCANVNYRLAPAASWPAQAEDVAKAVAWVRANIGARGGDPHKLFLLGHSSGAMLVALVGTDERYLASQGLKTMDLRGVVPMGSIMWDVELEQGLKAHGRERVEGAFRREPDNRMYANLDV